MRVTRENGVIFYVITALAVIWTLFQLYTAATGVLPALQQRSIHLLFALVLTFLVYPFKRGSDHKPGLTVDRLLFAGLAAWTVGYVAINHEAIWMQTSSLSLLQEVISLTLIILVLDAARRLTGWALPLVALTFLTYSHFGNYMPGYLRNKGYSLVEIARYQVMSIEGIFGIALGVIASFVFLFIFYSAILQVSGGGQIFIDLATALFGKYRGGPAKIAVVASAMFGTISGSAVANVATTGAFTIPLMKQTGYSNRFAGAVEAVASSGGQFMPPIMGSSAFLIAEILSIPYWQVALAALIPACLYFAAVFIMVDLEAVKEGIKGLPPSEVPSLKKTLASGWHLLLSPLALVVFLMILGWSPMKSAFWAIIVALASTFINPKNRLTLDQLFTSMRTGALGTLETSVACACVGLVIGSIMQTGVGFSLSSFLVGTAQGNLHVLLILTMVASLILGMGLPTVAAYLVLSVMVAPALVEMGVYPLAAHLFIFYFGIISAITPPVALASFVAAGISGDKPVTTSLTSLRLGLSAFILPFMFVYGPALILQGSPIEVLVATCTATLGVFALSCGLQRYFIRQLNFIESALFVLIALLLIYPESVTDIIGVVTVTLLMFYVRSSAAKIRTVEQ